MKHSFTLLTALLLAPLGALHAADRTTEVCVYGGTASGVMAAVAAKREGKSVIIVEAARVLGGMIGGGIQVNMSSCSGLCERTRNL